MRILIDALAAREGGGITYLREMLPALCRAGAEHEYHVLLSSVYQRALIERVSSVATPEQVELGAGDLARRLLYLARDLPRLLVDRRYGALFTVNEVGCWRPTRPHVVLARNYSIFAPLALFDTLSARWTGALYRATREPVARATLRHATHIAFVSDTYRQALVERLGLDERRTSVVHHGVDPAFASAEADMPAPAKSIDLPYLLCVSSIAPHKNYETLLRAFASARRATPLPRLAIAGAGIDGPYGIALRALVHSLDIESDVDFLGRVPYEQLPALYRGAIAFVFVSRLETFGQPLLEAMSAGTPVVAGDNPVSREICQDAALYVDALSADAIAASLLQVVTDSSLRARLSQHGRARARDFSWDRTARQTLGIIERAVQSPTS